VCQVLQVEGHLRHPVVRAMVRKLGRADGASGIGLETERWPATGRILANRAFVGVARFVYK